MKDDGSLDWGAGWAGGEQAGGTAGELRNAAVMKSRADEHRLLVWMEGAK